MIKVPITFEDLDGNEVTEDHYFHLSNSELIEWATQDGNNGRDLAQQLETTVKSGNIPEIMKVFKQIVHKSYGVREGAASFKKSQELSDQFMGSLAFDAFFMQLLTNTMSAVDFINGVIPSKLAKQIADQQEGNPGQLALAQVENESRSDEQSGLKRPRDSQGNLLPWAFRKPTDLEKRKMTRPQLQDVMNRMSSDWEPPAEPTS